MSIINQPAVPTWWCPGERRSSGEFPWLAILHVCCHMWTLAKWQILTPCREDTGNTPGPVLMYVSLAAITANTLSCINYTWVEQLLASSGTLSSPELLNLTLVSGISWTCSWCQNREWSWVEAVPSDLTVWLTWAKGPVIWTKDWAGLGYTSCSLQPHCQGHHTNLSFLWPQRRWRGLRHDRKGGWKGATQAVVSSKSREADGINTCRWSTQTSVFVVVQCQVRSNTETWKVFWIYCQ